MYKEQNCPVPLSLSEDAVPDGRRHTVHIAIGVVALHGAEPVWKRGASIQMDLPMVCSAEHSLADVCIVLGGREEP